MKNSIKNWAAALLWLAASSLPLHAQDVSTDTLSEEPLPLPFVEYFDNTESFLEGWTVRDSMGVLLSDSIAKESLITIENGGVASSPYIDFRGKDKTQWLISPPIISSTETAHISLQIMRKAINGTICIMIGNTPDIKAMTLLYEGSPDIQRQWQHLVCEFYPEKQPVYVAISTSSHNILIDALEIREGHFTPHELLNVLSMSSTKKPNDSIDLHLRIANEGTKPAYGGVLWYNVNGREYHQIEFLDTIATDDSKEIVISNAPLLAGTNQIHAGIVDMPTTFSGVAYNHQTLFPPYKIKPMQEDMAGEALAFIHIINKEFGNIELSFEPSNIISPLRGSDAPVVSRDFFLEAGKEYIINFEYIGGGSKGPGQLQLLLGESDAAWQEWDMLWEDLFIQQSIPISFITQSVNFTVPEDGEYSFGFMSSFGSEITGIQNISIEIANDENTYRISLNGSPASWMPLSGCGLDAIEIAPIIDNLGNADIHGFEAGYIVNGKDTIKEYIYIDLPSNSHKEFSFNNLASLEKGKNTVEIFVNMYKDKSSGGKNASTTIYNHTPLQTPHTINMEKEEIGIGLKDFYLNWGVQELPNGDFELTGASYYPISSTCFYLEAGKEYRIEFEYKGGSLFASGWEQPIDCYVAVYDITESVEAGKKIWTKEWLLDYNYQSAESRFTVDKDGFYAFAFHKIEIDGTRAANIAFKNISVSEVLDYDVQSRVLSDIPSKIPIEQINTHYPISVELNNRGLQDINVTVNTLLNGRLAGEFTGNLITGDTCVATLATEIPDLNIGDTATLATEASIDDHEAEDINLNHSSMNQFIVTDTCMSYYNTRSLYYNVGYAPSSYVVNGPRGIALPFHFSMVDTLTSVSIGWSSLMDNPQPRLRLAIYPFDIVSRKIMDEAIYQSEITRPRDSGWMVYDIPDLLLSGSVLVSVEQLDANAMFLAIDCSPQGYFYSHYIMSDSLIIDKTRGYPAIALNLGHNGVLDLKQDAEMVAFVNPSANIGAFAANEPITVRIRNNSADSVDVPVHLVINNQEAGSTTLRIAPYVSGHAVIEADLSQPNTQYDICVFAAMENDEDRSNDTLRMSLTTVPAMDPYVMDFEYTPDFAISDFQPEWTTVDNDGMPTYGWQYVSFPHTFEAFGFISFNPASTTPPIMDDYEMVPIQGRRFGVSFSTNANDADDWLISPKLQMPPSGSKISFWVKSFTKDYGYDQYRVLVSTTTNTLESFEPVTDFREAPDWDWKQEVVDLSAYNGKEIYIAIQRYQGEQGYGFVFMIDDIRVDKTGTGTESDASILDASLYPNPAQEKVTIFCDAGIQEVEIIDMNGRALFAKQGLKQDSFTYNVENLSPGLYFAKVRSSQGLQVLKFTVIE